MQVRLMKAETGYEGPAVSVDCARKGRKTREVDVPRAVRLCDKVLVALGPQGADTAHRSAIDLLDGRCLVTSVDDPHDFAAGLK